MPPKCPDAATKGPHEAYEDAICACYHRIFQRARQLHPDLPVIGMGHFYTPPTPFSEYGTSVGNSTAVNYNRLPPFDYLALGHMHKGYTLGGNSRWRYSGSLFTTKFQELGPDSQLMLLDTEKGLEPEAVTIPVYQTMKNLTGTREEIIDALTNLKNTEGETIWLHIHNTGDFWVNMHSDVLALLGDSRLVPVDVENSTVSPELREDKFGASTLADIRPEDIFDHMLEQTTLDDGYKRAFRNDLMLLLEECSNEPAEMMEITQEEKDEDNENSY
jgi:exonuclease SbcD